jgi:hypothetical protein
MMTQSIPKLPSDDLEELIKNLTVDQVRYVVARQGCSTDKEAAEKIGVTPQVVKRWKMDGVPIDTAVREMVHDGLVVARTMRRRNLAKAMMVKAAGLDSKSERVRQATATEILEGELGRATQPTDNTTTIEAGGKWAEFQERLINALAGAED